MKVNADTTRCQGHGRCALLAPDVFDVNDDGKVVVLLAEIGDDHVADVRDAVTSCPEAALELT
ncbi:ferredoxin [Streptomyces brasiliensis]|uniref:Ferredoxin n=1 Tax=Streptomyces brasiliensis TaxID=1954 RepID=A0A917P060_9ACTN|nr:ferredoxin [Streptomyces brasiliensis]GGJ41388.1 ferredoxin [Streptomyces brasiliensis]